MREFHQDRIEDVDKVEEEVIAKEEENKEKEK